MNNNGKKVANFIKTGMKKAFSANVGGDNYVTNKVKERSYDLYSNVRDFVEIAVQCILLIFEYAISLIYNIAILPSAIKRASQNNFRLGLESLKLNNVIEARIRFLLSNMFYRKSATTKYYIAYTYFMQGNNKKSLKYLQQALKLNSSHEKSIALLRKIEDVLSTNQPNAYAKNEQQMENEEL